MNMPHPDLSSLAARLPDLPRWAETRSLLLHSRPEIHGLVESPDFSFVLSDLEAEQIWVVGTPAAADVRAALEGNVRCAEVIAPAESGAWLANVLPEWVLKPATLHELSDAACLPPPGVGDVRFVDVHTLRDLGLPAELLEELESGAALSPIAASCVDGRPVSFCYAGSITESLWDISIDTLEEHRRRGHAALAVAYMIRYMALQGKRPVWGSLVENPGSWQLARKLGFVQVDELALFEPRPVMPEPEEPSSMK